MNRIYSLIGLAQRAGQVSSGTMAARVSMMRKRARVLVISNDIAENTREALLNISDKQQIPWIVVGSKHELGACVGKAYRVALTVNDSNLAGAILNATRVENEN